MKTIPLKALIAIPLISGMGFALPLLAADPAHKDKWNIEKLDLAKLPPAADRKGVTYDKDIRPLLEAACFRCHGEERARGELRVDSLEALLKGGEAGKVIIPKDSKKSLLLAAVAQVNDEVAMPPKPKPPGAGRPGPGAAGPGPAGGPPAGVPPPPGGPNGNPPGPGNRKPGGGPGGPGGFGPPPKPLTVEQVALIRAWIDQGAK